VQVLSTTHYGELKQFSSSAERFENASVEFDAKSLRPTYRLRIGIPGSSNAFDIAARLGMPPELVSRARRYLGRDRELSEVATQRLEETQRELSEQTESASRERQEIEKLRRDYETKLARLQGKMDEERARAQDEAQTLIRRVQGEADAILRELRSAASASGRENRETEAARGRLRSLRDRVAGNEARPTSQRTVAPTSVAAPAAPEARSSIHESRKPLPSVRPGDMVRVKSLGREGVLLEALENRERVGVRIGAMKLQVAARDIEAVAAKNTSGGTVGVQLRKSLSVEEEINLIGRTTDEALHELDKYLDDAVLSDAKEVRIIHGRGSGTLRQFIHHYLRDHPSVAAFALAPQNQGGEGATIAKLG
jgi:DNA mismatch repair protein MutS2